MRLHITGPAATFLVITLTALLLPTLAERPHGPVTGSDLPTTLPATQSAVIVEAESADAARAHVERVGGRVTHELRLIDGVAAELDAAQVRRLAETVPTLRIHPDAPVTLSTASTGSDTADPAAVPAKVGAEALHAQGLDGSGVTVAVLDTGLWEHDALLLDGFGEARLLAHYDARADRLAATPSDENGHGTHITGILASSDTTSDARYHGVAPNVDLVSVAAFDRDGWGTYADIIRGIEWIVDHRDTYDIRVLALAFSAPTNLPYWQDPLARAVMAAWSEGIVVVTSAGNRGPDPQTLGVPGNVPYVITVGGVGDTRLGGFSSAGPTEDDFVKPELVAPGVSVTSLMDAGHEWALRYPENLDGEHFTMSGTSQAMAAVAGAAALLLQADPALSPDDVKCRLVISARPAADADGTLAYSVFQQGAGLVDVEAAVAATDTGCANRGLDIEADLADLEHYRGPARQQADGTFVIEGGTGTWDATLVGGDYSFSSTTDSLSTLAETDGTPWVDDPVGGGDDTDPFTLGGPGLEWATTGEIATARVAIGEWVETP